MANTNYNNWNDFFIAQLSMGKYTFTYDDIKNEFQLSEQSIDRGLLYHSKQKHIIKIRKGFYGILTPENSVNGILPIYSFIDDLMASLHRPYYMALLSAGVLHGASHQKPMADFVITETPAPRNIITSKMKVYFISKHSWQQKEIIQKKTIAGYINVSSPELTAFDLVIYANRIGLNLVSTVLQELCEVMKPQPLKRIAKTVETPVIQRLGYILEKFTEAKKLSDILHKILENRTPQIVPLSIKKVKNGNINIRWKLIINTEIEPDL
jgi:predicted transcriptional regulator of viral defense system